MMSERHEAFDIEVGMKFKRTTWPKLLTLAEAAEELGLVAGTLRVQVLKGRLKATKISRDWMVEPEEVERYRREVLGRSGLRNQKALAADQ